MRGRATVAKARVDCTGTGLFSPSDRRVIKKIGVNYRAGNRLGWIIRPDILS